MCILETLYSTKYNTMQTISILTKEDLLNFKNELFQEPEDLLDGSEVSKLNGYNHVK